MLAIFTKRYSPSRSYPQFRDMQSFPCKNVLTIP